MRRKIFIAIIIAMSTVSLACISANAASTSALLDSSKVAQTLAENNPAEYNSPYGKDNFPEEYIDPSGGTLSLTENLLHLQGKNGLDVDLTVRYNSQLTDKTYGSSTYYYTETSYQNAYYYSYESNGQTKEILVRFETDEDMLEKAPISFEAKALPTKYTDYLRNSYYNYSNFSGSGILFTRVLDRKPLSLSIEARTGLELADATRKKQTVSDIWQLQIPMLLERVVPVCVDSGGGTADSLYEANDVLIDYTGEMATANFSYWKDVKTSESKLQKLTLKGTVGTYTGWYAGKNEVTDKEIGTYICYVTDSEGRTMYFNKHGCVLAVKDRFGNMIKYTYEDDQLTKIVDTFGRTITLERKGDNLNIYVRENGVEKIAASIKNNCKNNDKYDPNKLLEVDNDYTSCIVIYDDNDSYEKEVSYIKRDVIFWTSGKTTYKEFEGANVITKLTQPNGVVSNYSYERYEAKISSLIKSAYTIMKRSDVYDGEEYNKYKYEYSENAAVVTRSDGETSSYDYSASPEKKTVKSGNEKYVETYKYSGKRNKLSELKIRYNGSSSYEYTRIHTSYGYSDLRPKEISHDNYKNSITYFDGSNFVESSVYNSDKDGKKLVKTEYELSPEGDDFYSGRTIERAIISESSDAGKHYTEKYSIEYTYNSDGTLASETVDPAGINRKTLYSYTYGADGSTTTKTTVKGVADADGKSEDITSSVTVDERGRVINIVSPTGDVTKYTYNVWDNVTKVTNPDGTSKTYSYDLQNNTTTFTDENGIMTRMKYDGFGNPLVFYKNNGTNSSQSWVKAYEYEYDSLCRVKAYTVYTGYSGTTPKKWIRTEYTYGAFDKVIEERVSDESDKTLESKSYTYNYVASYASILNANRHDKENSGYSKNFTLVTINTTASDGITPPVVEQYYDRRGRLCKEIRTDGKDKYYTTYTYDELDNVLEEKNERAYAELNVDYSAKYEYDNFGNIVNIYNANGIAASNEYDALGRLISQTDAEGNTIKYTYDKLGRTIKESAPVDNTTSVVKYYYDPNGNVEKVTTSRASGTSSVTYAYDNRDRLIWSYDGISYTKNAYTGNQLTVTASGLTSSGTAITSLSPTNATYSVTKFTYDKFGNLATEENYNGKTSYTYDLAGHVLTTTDPKGTVTTNTYDSRGSLLKSTAGSDVITYTYNSFGLSTSAVRGSESASYTYDNFGRVVKETRPDATLSWEYNISGQPTRFTLTQGGAVKQDVTYAYDVLGNMESASSGDESVVYTYNDNALPITEEYSNGLITSYEYAPGNVIKSVNNQRRLSTDPEDTEDYEQLKDISYFAYNYAADGNVVQVTDTRVGYPTYVANYTYDTANRLTNAVIKSGSTTAHSWTYTYDKNGNMTKKVENDGTASSTTTYTYTKHRLTKETTDGSSTEYSYDANGNTVSKTGASGTYTYTYTPRNEVKSVTVGGKTYNYTYDASSLRQSVSDGTETKYYTWSGSNIVSEYSSASDRRVDYFYGVKRVSRTIRGKNYEGTHTEGRERIPVDNYRDYYLYDGRGNVAQLADMDVSMHMSVAYNKKSEYYPELEFGNDSSINLSDLMASTNNFPVTRTYYYSPYGEIWQGEHEYDTNPFRYSGEFYDKATGDIYLRARYYNPRTGRFLTVDPIKDGTNWYIYCNDNPIMFVDPSGLEDVMLSYIAQKNGGTAIYTKNSFLGIAYNKKVTVSMNGIKKTYTIGESDSVVRIVNGRCIIDNEILEKDFGLSGENIIHEAGDRFDSDEDAVLAFGLMYHEKSLDEQQEYGASINKDENGKFYFSCVKNSSQTYNKNVDDLDSDERNVVSMVFGNVGVVHTHWDSNGSLKFSARDNTEMIVGYRNGKRGNYYLISRDRKAYVATPDAKIEAPKSKKMFSF